MIFLSFLLRSSNSEHPISDHLFSAPISSFSFSVTSTVAYEADKISIHLSDKFDLYTRQTEYRPIEILFGTGHIKLILPVPSRYSNSLF